MNRLMKVIAVFLAMLMLVTMATACKNSDEDDLNAMLGGETSDSGFGDNAGSDDDSGEDGGNQSGNQSGNQPDGNTQNNVDNQDGGSSQVGNKTDKNEDKNDKNDSSSNKGENVNKDADEEKQQEIVDNFDATKKYDFANNPLLAESKPLNDKVEPSFDIDTTGFVKNNIKVSDLKGKTMTMITALEQANWFYYGPNGETYDEWTWFESLKKTYGLNFKIIESRFDKAPQQMITYMNAGKQLDIIPTHRSAFPQFILLSQPLDPYINLNYVDNSPGVDSRTMEQTKWDGTYRCIGPIGAVEVMWYNESMVESLGLPDPHKLWKQDKWDWEAWRNFLVAVPINAPNGQTKLCPWAMSEGNAWNYFARTNGVKVFDTKTENGKTVLVNNFEHPDALASWTFYADAVKSIDAVSRRSDDSQVSLYKDGATIMCYTAYLMKDYYQYDYARTQKYNWVPYPKGTAANAECVVMNYGNTMMIPKKVKNLSNIPYAVKLMEIWANRFTEALNDYYQAPFYRWTYEQRIEFFDYAAKNNQFALGGGRVFSVLTGNDYKAYQAFNKSFYHVDYNPATEAAKVKNVVDKALKLVLEFAA